ncbi:MAG: UDP-N-acetylmuramate dehydrogenase [Nocardioidaceae bacterium]
MLTRAGEPLSRWTTLRLGGPAARFVEVTTRAELYDVVAGADSAEQPVLVLGGGSNLVVADDGFPGTVAHVATSGVRVSTDGCGLAEVEVEAGESWEAIVARAVESEWVGVEALSGIPGSVGAVPIQNVGAYGQEVADSIVAVHVYDRAERRTRTLANTDCGFGYRTSVFKQKPDRYVVGGVTFRFRLGSQGTPIWYDELAGTLGARPGQRVASATVRKAVLELRRAKGMVLDADDHDTWSAGSFFTNPVLPADDLPDGAPAWAQPDGRVKTSAAWLIEHAGLGKGFGNERVSLSTKHVLALTNRGTAQTADLLELARVVRERVRGAYDIDLRNEPVLVGCRL